MLHLFIEELLLNLYCRAIWSYVSLFGVESRDHPLYLLDCSYFGFFFVPSADSMDEFFAGVNMMALVCALLFTFVAAIPIAWTTDELFAMDNRVSVGAEMWQKILNESGGTSFSIIRTLINLQLQGPENTI
jgi:hypothetical protein